MPSKYYAEAMKLRNDGFFDIDHFFPDSLLDGICSAILDLYSLQGRKIITYSSEIDEILCHSSAQGGQFSKLQRILELMEERDKGALYQVQKFFLESPSVKSIITPDLRDLCASILQSNTNHILFNGPGLFINRPNTERLLYKWHSEAHYYPKRRKFLNLWIPLMTEKTQANGTMSFKVGSHLRDFPFSEYSGYNKDSEGKSNHFLQYEIPECLLQKYPIHWCVNQPGDLVVFHRNTVHTSNLNKSELYSFALVLRAWDPSEDLTLSGSAAAKPYKDDLGRADLVVADDDDLYAF